MMNSGIRIATVVSCFVLLAACTDTDPVEDPDITGTWIPDNVPSETWGRDFEPRTASITFADETWSASDGCNKLVGDYEIEGDDFEAEAGSYVGTECLGGKGSYDMLLPRAEHVEVDGDTLTFRDGDDKLLMRLTRQ